VNGELTTPQEYIYYTDADQDGYGDINLPVVSCEVTPPLGLAAVGGDCDESNNAVHPGMTEVCGNNIDDNCDGSTDENCSCVNPPVADAGSPQTICSGDQVSLNGSISGGAVNATWSSSGNGSFTPSPISLNATYVPSSDDLLAGSVTLTLTTNATAGCPAGVSSTLITILPYPATLGAINGSSALCNPQGQQITYSVAAVPGATAYNWTVPSGTIIVSGQGTPSLVVRWPFSVIHAGLNGTICVTANTTSGCNSNTSCLPLSVQLSAPVTPASISGSNNVCPGDVVTYSVASVARASSYNWTLPAGMSFISGQGTNVISVSVNGGFTGGSITVSGVNICGTGVARSRTVALNIPRTPSVISGQASGLCNASGVNYSINPVSGATHYLWTVPAGATIIGPSNGTSVQVSYANTFTQGNLVVRAYSNCGASAERTLMVYGKPFISGPVNGLNVVCTGQTVTYNVPTVAGVTNYNWSVTAGASIISGQGTKTIEVLYGNNAGTGKKVTLTVSNDCGSTTKSLVGITINSCIKSIADAQEVQLYPNPATDRLNIRFESGESSQATLRLYDASGRVVRTQAMEVTSGENTVTMELIDLSTGMYFFELQTVDGSTRQTIMIDAVK
jgi:hypothetical protein